MRATVENLFTALGMTEEAAKTSVDVLIYADIRGIDSHGVSNMTPAYVHWLKNKILNATPDVKIARDSGAAVTIDCDKGLGLAVGPGAMDLAIERAKQYGIGVAIAFNAFHYGAAAYYAQRALAHDMIGMSMTTGGVLVAPTQGAEPLLGLNPIGIAVPSKEEVPFLFDASMSSVAANKIRLLQRIGGKVLPGWVTKADGEPVMEEAEVPEDYKMLPLGGTRDIGSHKGYGLMLMVEVLTSILAGTGGGPDRRGDSTHYFMAYNVEAFTDTSLFKDDMDTYLKRLRESKPAPGESRVVYPGIPEHESELERIEQGIPYHPDIIDWFKNTCEELQVVHRLDI
jgi:LDH2 family malate/lactate/ureidoglycolate dehydrogenase|tara:strand:- start:4463 stop:5485 length:1023 start_codon:yes stop_codon:yes gene_type:complete